MGELEIRFLIAILGVLVLFLMVFLFSKRAPQKSRRIPNSLFLFVILILVLIFVFQYSQLRPYNPISIAVLIISSFLMTGLFGFLLYPFGQLKVFVGGKKATALRLFFVIYFYMIYFILASQGLQFLFTGVINPQSIALTPEFERYALPTIASAVIIGYRLNKRFPSRTFEFMGDVARDIVYFSILMFWLSGAAQSSGVVLSPDLMFPPIVETSLIGLVIGFVGVGIEGALLWAQRDLIRTGKPFSIEKLFNNLLKGFLERGKDHQETLDRFGLTRRTAQKKRKPSPADRALKILDARFSIHFREQTLKASSILTAVLLLSMSLVICAFVAQKTVTILAPAYFVEIDELAKSNLPSDIVYIVSEGAESLQIDKTYAIPLVSIESSNTSFISPLSSRFSSLNSTEFKVLETGNYLTITIQKTYVETTVSTWLFQPVNYDQRNNANFDYRGFFREAEIFYSLRHYGYCNITTLSVTSFSATITSIQKIIFATNATKGVVLINILQRSETIIEEDKTSFISLDEEFMNATLFLIKQTKAMTTFVQEVASCSAPFSFPKQ